jgi:formate hydrogenlyase subunit 6/NADH:ubiquinone oxidoreductase subunit I
MMKFISRENLFVLLDGLKADYDVLVPYKKGIFRFYQSYISPSENIVIGEVRTTEPLKGFFTPAIEKVAEDFNPEIPTEKRKPFAIVGVKACDLHGFLIQDQVFLKPDRPDPFYARAREDNLIISADCTLALDTCFCLALGHNPYPESHFDINLSEVEGGFVVEAGSTKGRQTLESFKMLFEEASDSALENKGKIRKRTVAEVQSKIEEHEVPHQDQYQGMIERNYESKIWEEEAKRCVECGGCTMICPTCHCFVLSDQKEGDQFSRCRQWDSCMFRDFAQVAGGGNPRSQLAMRLRNRFEKKFDYFPKVADLYACTGCGRCISGCPANIDIRKVLKRLVHDE